MTHPAHWKLPSVLPPTPALQDVNTTAEEVKAGHARVTNAEETPIFICGVEDCYKLFPSRERVMAHRKRDHDSEEEAQEEIITWKMLEADQGET
ncbi:hypothetical protein C2E23DRAFT_802082 [Lenzites betulinus]|nr:hypothetical protein C2E23DRAFT_802082 [Lenzites betulinus]